jgi:hypothetical protein
VGEMTQTLYTRMNKIKIKKKLQEKQQQQQKQRSLYITATVSR